MPCISGPGSRIAVDVLRPAFRRFRFPHQGGSGNGGRQKRFTNVGEIFLCQRRLLDRRIFNGPLNKLIQFIVKLTRSEERRVGKEWRSGWDVAHSRNTMSKVL